MQLPTLIRKGTLALILLLPFGLGAEISLPDEIGGETQFTVSGETDGFSASSELISVTEGVGRYSVRFPSPVISEYPENNYISGELYLPLEPAWTGDPTILLHILNGDFSLERLIAFELARAGVPAFWFKLPFYGERRPASVTSSKPISPDQLLQLIDQGVEDFRRSVDLMQQLSHDPDTAVNVTGTSMGGILAYHFASHEPRVGKISSIMSGGDLWGIVQTARETRKLWQGFSALSPEDQISLQKEIFKRDPLNAASRLTDKAAAGEILMINAAEDEVIPRKHAEQLADALGVLDQVVWIEGVGHYTMASRLNDVIQMQIDFFSEADASTATASTPSAPSDETDAVLFARFLTEMGTLIDPTTVLTAGQQLHLDFTWKDASTGPRRGSLDWQRSNHGFSLQLQEHSLGKFGIGESDRPWLFIGQQGILLRGQDPGSQMTYLEKTANNLSMKLQLLANFLQFGARIPGFLDEHGSLTSTHDGAIRNLNYKLKRRPGSLSLTYNTETHTFTTLEVRHKETKLSANITAMDIRIAADQLQLNPPKANETLPVTSLHLQHAIALLLEVIDEKLPVKFF